ncbi:TRAP transporter permease [Pyrococcus kukulkanii]|uniref:C4-dicarboxylate ABC transporter permease n=1 Tax=Pyrococcus kukulkanii TaxID=1609559 RepID=A0A127BAA0_9EURY|nr:TRAP transporter fused permease subunit [Pyrococcus kukulkanii]AMM54254.1 C4-dicarboxylate ABC transporter permease [Pyrococcus kukulkanii]
MEDNKLEKLEIITRTRELPRKLERIVSIAAILIGIYEILFIFNFNGALYDMLSRLGIKPKFLLYTLQSQQGEAFVLGMILLIAYLLYPAKRTKRFMKKISVLDYTLIGLSLIAMFYLFFRYPSYAEMATVYPKDVIFALMSILVVLEATRRVIGWVLPLIVLVFLSYALYNIGFNWEVFAEHMYLASEGLFATPLYVMTIYVFAFIFFGAFLLKIGISDYITEFMITLFGARPGGPAKAAVIASGLMGTVSGSSVANVLTTGTFTIPLMKRAGYPPEIAGAVEPVASTGGQLMPPIMGAAAFIMAEFLGIPYNKIIIAAVIPAIVYYAGVYLFIDRETKRLGLRGMPKEGFKPLKYFLRKSYILLPIVVITIALVWGIPAHISAISSLGVAIWVAWISKDEIYGNEALYVAVVILGTLAMFSGRGYPILLGAVMALVVLGVLGRGVRFNEKMYITLMFLLFIALNQAIGMTKENLLFLTGIMGILFSLIVGSISKTKDGKTMFSATYESMIEAGKTSTAVMLAAASAGLIQGSLTITGLANSLGYKLADLTGGNLWLLLMVTMIFSLILGMGVPTTANYIITSLVMAPAIYQAVSNVYPYNQNVPGFGTAIALLAAHLFVFYFGILADITPPVALASYAGSALAGGDFWKTALNAVRYAAAGYIGPYIYFTHPEMFIITVQEWSVKMVATVVYDLFATILVLYMLSIGLTGWLKGNLGKLERIALIVVALFAASLNQIPVGIGIVILGILFAIQRRKGTKPNIK